MDEYICPAIVGRDEAKTLVLVEKFNGTGCHLYPRQRSGLRAAGRAYSSLRSHATFPLRDSADQIESYKRLGCSTGSPVFATMVEAEGYLRTRSACERLGDHFQRPIWPQTLACIAIELALYDIRINAVGLGCR
ncbi:MULTISPECIES: hypothetical protein [unclassified Ensifer]|uniref:hypothetical protein n=1 Tax=unclassified Ensifer TaxID=2633371 RepID=UPI00192A30BA|nr:MULTISPECIES: hypothetical protein [unclassified Ensifer]